MFASFTTLCLSLASAAAPSAASPVEDVAEEANYALLCAKVLTVDDEDHVYTPGMILVEDGRITYVGAPVEVPAGYNLLEYKDAWAAPGLVDLHTHIHAGGFRDTNDMVLPANPELRASPTLVPSNDLIRRACAGGVTTLLGIPGSGTSLSGFGVLYKAKTDAHYDEAVMRSVGGMKVAQTHNPERRAGDIGMTRGGLSWLLEDVNDRAVAALEQGRFDLQLEDLKRVHAGEIPVLIHCAAAQGVAATARMWKERYGTHSVLSHGSFNGHKAAKYVASLDMPVNHGPRTMDYRSTRTGEIVGTAKVFVDAGVPFFSLNTDSGVVDQETFFLQAAMSARLGADPYQMLRALTIHPAKAFGIDSHVGSLEAGKDADVVIYSGDPLDPRSRVEVVLIDGSIQYDRNHDGQWF
jgi:imidazolonepropionase-like amidohydrolase